VLNSTNRIRILFWFVIAVLPISFATAALLETTQPIKLESTPLLVKIGSINQISAKSADYSDILPIDGVAIRLRSETKPKVYFRFLDSSETWSDWKSAHLFEEPFTDRWIAAYNNELVDNSHQFEVKIEVSDNSIVKILEQGVFPVDTEVYPDKALSKPIIFPTDIPKPIIISRQEWGARKAKDSRPIGGYSKLTIHHSAGYAPKNLAEGKKTVKAIQDYHMDGRGWWDVGYHFLIDQAGNIYQGRPETKIGAHVGNQNTGNIGVCIMGCYHPPYSAYPCNDVLTQESRDATVHLFAWLVEQYGYGNADVLKGHRDYATASTSCPGDNIHKLLPEIRKEIDKYIEFGGPPYEYTMSENYPNPFFTSTTIGYNLPVESDVTINIYNIMGETVIKLLDETQLKGSHSINWNGLDNRNNLSHTGVYFYQIQTHQDVTSEIDEYYSETGKMLFLK